MLLIDMVLNSSGILKFSNILNEMKRTGKISISNLKYYGFNDTSISKFNIRTFYNYSYFPLIIENSVPVNPILISGTTYYYIFTIPDEITNIDNIDVVNTFIFNNYNLTCKVLLVGGGGACGSTVIGGTGDITTYGGGGGAGEVIYFVNQTFTKSITYTINVGYQGRNDGYQYYPDGQNSSITTTINNVTTLIYNARGGKTPTTNNYGGTSGNNYIGGIRSSYTPIGFFYYSGGGGGGGSSGIGGNSSSGGSGGNGGNGTANSITGVSYIYGTGGGGGGKNTNGSSSSNYGSGGTTNVNLNGFSGCVVIQFTLL